MRHQRTYDKRGVVADRVAGVAFKERVRGDEARTLVHGPRSAHAEAGRVVRIDQRHRADLDRVGRRRHNRSVDRYSVGDLGVAWPQQQEFAKDPGAVRPERRAALAAVFAFRSPVILVVAAAGVVDQPNVAERRYRQIVVGGWQPPGSPVFRPSGGRRRHEERLSGSGVGLPLSHWTCRNRQQHGN